MTIIQLYEIQGPWEAEQTVEMGVQHIGTVLPSEEDIGHMSLKGAVRRTNVHGGTSSLLPLFREPQAVFRALEFFQPDIVHFAEDLYQGDLSNTQVPTLFHQELLALQQQVREHFPKVRIQRTLPIGLPGQGNLAATLALARYFEPATDIFLTDTHLGNSNVTPEMEADNAPGFVGITGRTCDWEVAAALVQQTPVPVILGGGLSPDNVLEALKAVHPWGVDSCTGTNARYTNGKPIRFRKSFDRIRKFVYWVREFDKYDSKSATETPR